MILKLNYLLLVCWLFLPSTSISQEVYTGSRKYLSTGATESVYYKVYNSSSRNIFYNKYSIFTKNENRQTDTIYTFQLNFNKENNLIEIRQQDKHSNQSDLRVILFEPLSYLIKKSDAKPIYTVKDFRFNDTTLSVNEDNNARILFTISDTIDPIIIYLHQIVTYDNTSQFNLDKFRKSHLNPHLSHARDYWDYFFEIKRKHVADSLLNAKNRERAILLRRKIEDEKYKIELDKDSLFRILGIKEQELLLKDADAKDEAQRLFRERMNKIFLDYYKADTVDKKLQANYEILSTVSNKIEIVKNPLTKYPNLNDFRFIFSYLNVIDSAIIHLRLANEKIPLYSNDPLAVLRTNHETRFNDIITSPNDQGIDFNSEFVFLFNNIQKEFSERFDKQLLEVPTRYYCQFDYTATTNFQKWRLRNKKILAPKDSVVDPTSNNYQFFFKEFPKAKNGKYSVKLNTAVINDKKIGPTAISVKRKYKYTTRIGSSIGLFTPVRFLGDPKYDFGNIYYDFFLTYHHLGFFGGFSPDPNKGIYGSGQNSQKYYEGGIYLAPGNVFYFKFGLSKYSETGLNTSMQPLTGISLIFPFFQIEGGVNLTFRSLYATVGLNIPINL
jgi:hypothetical protein